jgi:short-subunit dehydrogenase
MNLNGTRTLLTGAAGGLGAEMARQLAARGARLALVDRNAGALGELVDTLRASGGEATAVTADLLDAGGCAGAAERAREVMGGIDLLVNSAGLQSFRVYVEEEPATIDRLIRLNLVAPMLLTRAVLPAMVEAGKGRIVNVGSTFGSIAFACFTAYSASKFGLRGFSEALRRELDGSGVGVTYVAPRAARTALNTGAVYRMAQAVKMPMDEPSRVAERVVEAVEHDRQELYLGWPESLFVRVNALLPRLVDRVMARFATETE